MFENKHFPHKCPKEVVIFSDNVIVVSNTLANEVINIELCLEKGGNSQL